MNPKWYGTIAWDSFLATPVTLRWYFVNVQRGTLGRKCVYNQF